MQDKIHIFRIILAFYHKNCIVAKIDRLVESNQESLSSGK